VTGARTARAGQKASEAELTAWWSDLSSSDSRRAGAAVGAFLRVPEQGVAFLQERLRPAEVVEDKLLARLVADLDAAAFARREAAARALANLGERAEAALRQALKGTPSLEMKRRLEALLRKIENNSLSADSLQALRAIEALEHIGTPGAERLLATVAQGTSESRVTQQAKAALGRLGKRSGMK
jgi:hypothetical protein